MTRIGAEMRGEAYNPLSEALHGCGRRVPSSGNAILPGDKATLLEFKGTTNAVRRAGSVWMGDGRVERAGAKACWR